MPKKHQKYSKSPAASSVSPVSMFKPVDPFSVKGLFEEGPHEVNWYVNRSDKIRGCLKKLWNGGPQDKDSTQEASIQQKIATQANILMRKLERHGPIPQTWPGKIKLDPKHGACNRPDSGCVSKGFYHTHLSNGKLTYEIMWEAFESEKLINIVAIDAHENFDFKRKAHNPLVSFDAAKAAATKAGFDPDKKFDHATYNNSIK